MIGSYHINNLLLSSHEITSVLEKTVYKELGKRKSAIPSCSRYLVRIIYQFRLNSCNTTFSQNVKCACKNALSVKYMLFECPVTADLFPKTGYDFNACNNVKDILNIVITSVDKLIVYNSVGKLVLLTNT